MKQPRYGKQRVHYYGNGMYQVSTYGLNGWIISYCPASEIKSIKKEHHSSISSGNV